MKDDPRIVSILEELAKDFDMDMCCGTCSSCTNEEEDDYESMWGHSISGNGGVYCELNESMSNLKSFPFKKHKQCWRPNFWYSRFASMLSGDDEVNEMARAEFNVLVDWAEKRIVEVLS